MVDIPRTENVAVELLATDGKNPNKMAPEQLEALKKNIQKFGFIIPIVTNEDLLVADGEHRLTAARALGMEAVPVVRLPLKEVDRRTLRQVLNKLKGSHDPGLDIEEYRAILAADGNFEEFAALMGRDEAEFSNILKKVDFIAKTEDDAVPDVQEDFVKPGELWYLGKHRLLCGDSTKVEDVLFLMGGELASLLVTDPPWNVAYGSSKNPQWKQRSIINDDLGEEFGAFCDKFSKLMVGACKPGAAAYVFMSAQEWPVIDRSLREAGLHWSSTIIWVKHSLIISRKDYHTQYEPMWYGWKDGSRLHPLLDRTQSDVWNCKKPNNSELHPTMKPVELIERAILNSSVDGELVLDPFGGSGSTLIAAEKANRRCAMIELDPHYCSVIVRRWEEFTGLKAERAAK